MSGVKDLNKLFAWSVEQQEKAGRPSDGEPKKLEVK